MLRADLIPQFSDVLDRLADPPPALLGIRNDARDGAAMAQHDNRRALLDLVEQLREMRLRARGLPLAHLMFLPVPKGHAALAETASFFPAFHDNLWRLVDLTGQKLTIPSYAVKLFAAREGGRMMAHATSRRREEGK